MNSIVSTRASSTRVGSHVRKSAQHPFTKALPVIQGRPSVSAQARAPQGAQKVQNGSKSILEAAASWSQERAAETASRTKHNYEVDLGTTKDQAKRTSAKHHGLPYGFDEKINAVQEEAEEAQTWGKSLGMGADPEAQARRNIEEQPSKGQNMGSEPIEERREKGEQTLSDVKKEDADFKTGMERT